MSKSLRKILRQDYKEVLDKNPDPNSQSWGRNIESRGMMCSEAFHALFTEKNDNADNEHELSEEDTRLLLVKLNLAWACESKMLFIPSLIFDKNADDIRMKADIKIGQNYTNHVGFCFKFNLEINTNDIYNQLLMHLQSREYCSILSGIFTKDRKKTTWMGFRNGRISQSDGK